MKYFRNNIVPAIMLLFFFCSCATQHKPIAGIQQWPFIQSQFDSAFNFSYVDHVLELSGNKRAERWAKRKKIHVLAVRIINNTKRPIHGTQLHLFNDSSQLEILQNEWLARKVRQRKSPLMLLALPAIIIESDLWNRAEGDEPDYSNNTADYRHPLISGEIADQEEQRRKSANFNLEKELKNFQVSSRIYRSGEPVFGIVGVKAKAIGKLELRMTESTLQIVGY